MLFHLDCILNLLMNSDHVKIIFQKSPDTGVVPGDWQNFHVSAVFKEGDSEHSENLYNYIAFLNTFLKLL